MPTVSARFLIWSATAAASSTTPPAYMGKSFPAGKTAAAYASSSAITIEASISAPAFKAEAASTVDAFETTAAEVASWVSSKGTADDTTADETEAEVAAAGVAAVAAAGAAGAPDVALAVATGGAAVAATGAADDVALAVAAGGAAVAATGGGIPDDTKMSGKLRSPERGGGWGKPSILLAFLRLLSLFLAAASLLVVEEAAAGEAESDKAEADEAEAEDAKIIRPAIAKKDEWCETSESAAGCIRSAPNTEAVCCTNNFPMTSC